MALLLKRVEISAAFGISIGLILPVYRTPLTRPMGGTGDNVSPAIYPKNTPLLRAGGVFYRPFWYRAYF